MNENSTKWVVLSLAKYLTEFLAPDYVWIIGTRRPNTDLSPDRFEIKYLGPDIIGQQRNYTKLELAVNCQIITLLDPMLIDRHLYRVGRAQKMLTTCIPTYRYGSNEDTDDKSEYFPLQRKKEITTTCFGVLDPSSSSERTTVEATYFVEIEGED